MCISSNRRILRNLFWCVFGYHFHVFTCRSRICVTAFLCCLVGLYRMSQEECARLRESVPYVKVYRYNPKHL